MIELIMFEEKIHPKRILVIDDELEVVTRLKNILTSHGYLAITALDGIEGLQKALDEIPDLILLDIVMPKKSGFKMLAELKNYEKTKDIPVILVSAKSETSSLNEGARFRATDYIIKPIIVEDLLKYVAKYLKIAS